MEIQIEEIENIVYKALYDVGNAIEKYIGTGIEYARNMDECASEIYSNLIGELKKRGLAVNLVSIEGVRDGDRIASRLFAQQEKGKGSVLNITIDPIEGTHSGAMGGSRCLSAIKIAISEEKFKQIDDNLSCFYLASNKSKDFVDYLEQEDFWHDTKFVKIMKEESVGTLRRNESFLLWEPYIGDFEKIKKGEESFYLPSILCNNVFFAGDTSLYIPFETDYFMGRTGATEAEIESVLWKYWKGILVSGKKMKTYPHGELQYLQDRLEWAAGNDKYCINDFFEGEEIERMFSFGWSISELSNILDWHKRKMMYSVIYIVSFTGTQDQVLMEHSQYNMAPMKRTEGRLELDIWKKVTME